MLRRVLGLFVMVAGILGLLLSVAGLVGLWMVKPRLTASVDTTIATLATSIEASQQTLAITDDALSATATSVDALSAMLDTTATTVGDTQPIITATTALLGDMLPTTLQATADSLQTAEAAARSLESTIRSVESFEAALAANPLLAPFLPAPQTPYNPEKPLAESLGELRTSIEAMPVTFEAIATDVDKAGASFSLVKANLETMSQSVTPIASSLREYQGTIAASQTSMADLAAMLTTLQGNLPRILSGAAIGLTLFLVWLLATQIVVFSQGWELYRGTADRMAGRHRRRTATEAKPED